MSRNETEEVVSFITSSLKYHTTNVYEWNIIEGGVKLTQSKSQVGTVLAISMRATKTKKRLHQ
jgi:hypothetical protein